MERLYKMGPVTLAFRELPQDRCFPFRDWKLDAFALSEGRADIAVCWEPGKEMPASEPVWTEKSLCAKRELYQLSDGSMLWQQIQPATKQVQLQLKLHPDRQKISLLVDSTQTFGMAALESLTFLIFYAFLSRNVLSFHGLLLENRGKGILIAAPSGEGSLYRP